MNDSNTLKTAPKLRPGFFKCYQCRKTCAAKEGSWYAWDTMEVHLCFGCERETRAAPERKRA